MKVRKEDFGAEKRPKLMPEVLKGAAVAVLTIKEADTSIEVEGRRAAVLTFEDVPPDDAGLEYVLWLNATGIGTLVDRLGDDDSDWKGEKIPLVKVNVRNPRTQKFVEKYAVADGDDWDDLLKEFAARAKKPARRR